MIEKNLGNIDPTIEDDGREFHIVGIGASAGGLEALNSFFKAIPDDTGMGFVVVQHLSPDFKSHMEDLLKRHTKMTIHRVENGMEVEPNSVYLIPPKMVMIVSEGKLLLTEREKESLVSHPIDQFFRSLASDIGRYSVGVILSGTGSDGSRGIRDIHESGGLVLAQDEQTAGFDGMPLNAQATGVVDVVLPPEGIAEALVKYVKEGLDPESLRQEELLASAEKGIDRIFQLLNTQHGIDFSHYRISTVSRRIQRRIQLMGMDSLEEYLTHLETDPTEVNDLYKDLLIGVTRFFRDPEAFETLEQDVIPELVSKIASQDRQIRIWVAGCASGEEAYSIAILFDEEIKRRRLNLDYKIFATDAHHVSLNIAAKGIYPEEALEELSQERKAQYFRKNKAGYVITREIRRNVVFAPHNVISDAPFTQMDLVTCRNMLIYFQSKAQKKAISMFHFALRMGGVLFLGPSETPGDLIDEFQTIDKRWRLFRKRRDVRLPIDSRLPLQSPNSGMPRTSTTMSSSNRKRIDSHLIGMYDRLLDRKMPPSILIDENYEMLHIFGGAQKYLRSRGGRPTQNLLDLVHEDLKTSLAGAIQHSLSKHDTVRYTGVDFSTESGVEKLKIIVEPFTDAATGMNNFLVEFESVGVAVPDQFDETNVDMGQMSRDRVDSLESELRYTQENLQATIEELETANEELQATNEEMVASNEELQSTNEELHSVNEELFTVNAEHQTRLEELARANDDMDNLLATTRVGVLFLDDEFCIRRYTPEMARLFHLVPHDIGRSIEGFAHHLNLHSIIDDLGRVISEQREFELRVEDRHGSAFLLRMLPYRSGDYLDGVVLTLIDIQSLSIVEKDLERFKFMTESALDSIILVNFENGFEYVNPAMCELVGYHEEELKSLKFSVIDKNYTYRSFEEIFKGEEVSDNVETEFVHKDGSIIPVEISYSIVKFGHQQFLYASIRDISARRAATLEMRLLQSAIDAAKDGIIMTDATHGKNLIQYVNKGFVETTGFSVEEARGRSCNFLQGPGSDVEVVAEIRQAIKNAQPFQGAILNYRKDGSPFWNDLSISPVFDTNGELMNFVGIQHDVTDERRIRHELEDARFDAQQANLAKSAFLANMSHELRTPMTAVLGFAEMLESEVSESNAQEKISTIKKNGSYLLALLNDILDLSKIEAGKLDVKQSSVDIRAVIDDVKTLISNRIQENNVPIRFEWGSKVPQKITADDVRIRQILINIIGNAIKFTESGEIIVRVELQQEVETNSLVIKIIDTGIGIPEEQIEQIFNPFSRVSQRTSREFGGTGLGLSISQRLAEYMGGSISVESEPGQGSEFSIHLPVSPDQAQVLTNGEDYSGHSESNKPLVDLPKLDAKILLVDDRRDVWRVANHFLERAGAKVTIAENGRLGVQKALDARSDEEPFDLILLDIQMPVMNGKEAVAELRKLGFTTPVIALTADAMEGDKEEYLRLGFNDYLPKPIDRIQLISLVDAIVNQ